MVQGHRVDYDDGDSLQENLTHRTHRLPDLAGDMVFNPEADAESPMVPYCGPDYGAKSGQKADMKSGGKPGAKPGGKAGTKSGMALKGQRIEVWWAQDEEFYSGVVTSYKKVHSLIVFNSSWTQGFLTACLVAVKQTVGMCICFIHVCSVVL